MEQQLDKKPEPFVSPFLERPLRDLRQAWDEIRSARAQVARTRAKLGLDEGQTG